MRLLLSEPSALEFLRLIMNEDVKDEEGVAFAEFEGRFITKDASLVYAGEEE
jgi:hypothetical protein